MKGYWLINKQIRVDRGILQAETDSKPNSGRRGRITLVTAYHPVLNSVEKAIGNLYSMLLISEEHREVFPEPPVITSRRCKNFKYKLVLQIQTSRMTRTMQRYNLTNISHIFSMHIKNFHMLKLTFPESSDF